MAEKIRQRTVGKREKWGGGHGMMKEGRLIGGGGVEAEEY